MAPVSTAATASLIYQGPDVDAVERVLPLGTKETPPPESDLQRHPRLRETGACNIPRGPSANSPVSWAGGGVRSSLPKYFTALNFSPGCKSNTAFYLQMWFESQKFSGQGSKRGTAGPTGWASPREPTCGWHRPRPQEPKDQRLRGNG